MSRLSCRGSIVRVAILAALFSSRPAGAQQVGPPYQPTEPGGLVNDLLTGVWYDRVNQAKAEKRLQQVQAKLQRDAERCDSAAVNHDARRIENYRFRIVVDEWLIRQNSLLDPGCYPYPVRLDPMSCAAIAQYHQPSPAPYSYRSYATQGPLPTTPMRSSYPSLLGPTPSSMGPPTVSVTIVNAAPAGSSIAFSIDGLSHDAPGGSRQDVTVSPDSVITYESGGPLGPRRYRLTSGVYEFRSTAEGWALYLLPNKP